MYCKVRQYNSIFLINSKINLDIEANILYNTFRNGPVVQLVRTLACHARGRRFEPVPGRHFC